MNLDALIPRWYELLQARAWFPPVFVLAAAAALHIGLRVWMKMRLRAAAPGGTAGPGAPSSVRRWLARSFHAGARPVLLLIWIHGIYLAVALLLQQPALQQALPETAPRAVGIAYGVALIAALMWLFARAGVLLEEVLIALSRRTAETWDDLMLPLLGRMGRRVLPLLAVPLGISSFAISETVMRQLHTMFAIAVIAVIAWLMFQIVDVTAVFVLRRYRVDVANNLQARAIHTQVAFLRKVVESLIVLLALASILMVFDSVRQFGASILASAGIAGIAVGLAAQRSLSNLFAGLQIAITQPIRVDDVVIVEGEWGRVEEITLTYVVVKIWDERRMVVPIAYFIEKPFQNWTRTGSAVIGSVFLYVDYRTALDPLRQELSQVLTASRYWDRRVNVLQVTDIKDRMIELRALVSANDAGTLWDLRCEVREKLVAFVNREEQAWPFVRASLERNRLRSEVGRGD